MAQDMHMGRMHHTDKKQNWQSQSGLGGKQNPEGGPGRSWLNLG
jgi:hypothetical protein